MLEISEARDRSFLLGTMASHPVSLQRDSEKLHLEMLQLVCSWLGNRGYITTLQMLRDEAGALLRDENEQRKNLRLLGKSVDEGAWDTVLALARKLDLGKDTRTVQYVLARQQFLELVEEGDGQRAFTYSTRRLKPMEEFVGKQQFLDLAYALTCRNVLEASAAVTSLRGWSVASGRQAIFATINAVAESKSGSEFWKHNGIPVGSNVTLERVIEQALSFQLVESTFPSAIASLPVTVATTFIANTAVHPQRPTRVLVKASVSTNTGVRSVYPLREGPGLHGAILGMDNGQVLWIPSIDLSGGSDDAAPSAMPPRVVASHAGRVWDIDGAEEHLIISVGGTTACILSPAANFAECLVAQATCELTAVALVRRGKQNFVCGSAGGDVFVGDTTTAQLVPLFSQPSNSKLSCGAVAQLRTTSAGLSVFVAYRSGTIAAVDILTGVCTLQLSLPIPCELSSIAISSANLTLAASYKNNTVRLWDIISGELLSTRLTCLSVHNMTRCVFLTENVVAASCSDGYVYSWDLASAGSKSAVALPLTSPPEANLSSSAFSDSASGSAQMQGSSVLRSVQGSSASVNTLLPSSSIPVANGCAVPFLADMKRFDSHRQELIVASLNGEIAIIGV